MLNIGGVKTPPGPLIERIKSIDDIQDVTVANVRDPAECEVLLIAVETRTDPMARDYTPPISAFVQRYADSYELLHLKAFPRTHTGIIRREGIQEAYRLDVPEVKRG